MALDTGSKRSRTDGRSAGAKHEGHMPGPTPGAGAYVARNTAREFTAGAGGKLAGL
jgi:hypothetical protein